MVTVCSFISNEIDDIQRKHRKLHINMFCTHLCLLGPIIFSELFSSRFSFFFFSFSLFNIYKTLNNNHIYLFSGLYFKMWSNFTIILTPSKISFLYYISVYICILDQRLFWNIKWRGGGVLSHFIRTTFIHIDLI